MSFARPKLGHKAFQIVRMWLTDVTAQRMATYCRWRGVDTLKGHIAVYREQRVWAALLAVRRV